MTDDEKFLWKDLKLEECHRLGYSNVYEAQLDTAGTIYFACQVGAHCTSGQKIAVAVA